MGIGAGESKKKNVAHSTPPPVIICLSLFIIALQWSAATRYMQMQPTPLPPLSP